MKNLKRRGKGFTITELLVVIAIIGILAIVLIPKFGSMIGDAKEAGYLVDAQTVKTIVTKSVISDNTVPTHTALNAALTEAGYTVTTIAATGSVATGFADADDTTLIANTLVVQDTQDNVYYLVAVSGNNVYMVYPNKDVLDIAATTGNTGITASTGIYATVMTAVN